MSKIESVDSWTYIRAAHSETEKLLGQKKYNQTMIKARQTLEYMVATLARKNGITEGDLVETIDALYSSRIISRATYDRYHSIRVIGNKAISEEDSSAFNANNAYHLLSQELLTFANDYVPKKTRYKTKINTNYQFKFPDDLVRIAVPVLFVIILVLAIRFIAGIVSAGNNADGDVVTLTAIAREDESPLGDMSQYTSDNTSMDTEESAPTADESTAVETAPETTEATTEATTVATTEATTEATTIATTAATTEATTVATTTATTVATTAAPTPTTTAVGPTVPATTEATTAATTVATTESGSGTLDTSVRGNYAPTTVVNVRQSPSTESALIDKVGAGRAVPVLGEIDGWYQIDVGWAIGYVRATYMYKVD